MPPRSRRKRRYRRLRRIARLAALLAFLGAVYIGAAAVGLHRTASELLAVGTLSEALAQAPRPTDPGVPGYRGDPETALGLPFETLAIQTALGPAEAWLVPEPFRPGAPQPHLAAVYVHGIAGAREDGYRHLPLLHAAGLPTLLISYRNDDNAPASPEGRYGFGLTEWPDLEAAILALRDRGYPEVMVVADAMGAAILGQFLARSPEASRVSAIALDSPALEFRATLRNLASLKGLPLPRTVTRLSLVMLSLTQPADLRAASGTGRFAGFGGPLFVAHGAGDRIVPLALSHRLLDLRAASDNGAWTVGHLTGADHLASYAEDPEAYTRDFTRFLEMADGP